MNPEIRHASFQAVPPRQTEELAHGANPGLLQGQALRNAAQGGHLEIAQLLVQAGVDVKARDESGEDALRIAVHFAHVALVEWLLTQGASPDGEDGKTLLEAAGAYSGPQAEATLSLLLAHGATAHRHGDAVLLAARTSPGLAALLLAHGANPSALSEEEKYFLLPSQGLRSVGPRANQGRANTLAPEPNRRMEVANDPYHYRL